jgi:hypothetical protein
MTIRWRKSSRSQGGGNNCVEVGLPGLAEAGPVLVRDSKLGEGSPRLAIPRTEFAALLNNIKI